MAGWRKAGKGCLLKSYCNLASVLNPTTERWNWTFLSLQCEHHQERNRDKITEKVFVSLKRFTCKTAEKNTNTNRELWLEK